MLSPAPDSPAAIPLVRFGRASLNLYPRFVDEIEEISGRRIGYRNDGAIELLFSTDAERELSTLIALHHALGLPTEPLPLDEAAKLEPALTRRAQGAAYFPYEACVDNRALLEALSWQLLRLPAWSCFPPHQFARSSSIAGAARVYALRTELCSRRRK